MWALCGQKSPCAFVPPAHQILNPVFSNRLTSGVPVGSHKYTLCLRRVCQEAFPEATIWNPRRSLYLDQCSALETKGLLWFLPECRLVFPWLLMIARSFVSAKFLFHLHRGCTPIHRRRTNVNLVCGLGLCGPDIQPLPALTTTLHRDCITSQSQ